jgi:multisubunit Na+/H+ antiporter MnhB subunit
MLGIDIIIVALILLMIIGALVAIETSSLLFSVISLGAVGFLLSIVFLFLSAPDLAITQIAVEVITLVLLLRATGSTERDSAASFTLGKLTALGIVLVVAVFAAPMLAELPRFGSAVMDRLADTPSETYLRQGAQQTGVANIVTAVLLDYRAYDTLGETTVLFCAISGALMILRQQLTKPTQETDEEDSQ